MTSQRAAMPAPVRYGTSPRNHLRNTTPVAVELTSQKTRPSSNSRISSSAAPNSEHPIGPD